MNVFHYLNTEVKTKLGPSSIHGIGTFAIRDLEVGETLFKKWEGETRIYTLSKEEFEILPDFVKEVIKKSYVQQDEYPVIWFRLFRGCYFDLANPIIYTNTGEENGNFDSLTKTVIKPIKKGEEILGTYKLKDTLL